MRWVGRGPDQGEWKFSRGDGWFASRIEMAAGTISRYPSGASAMIPFVLSMWGFWVASIFSALMTIGGYGEDGDKFVPGMLFGALIMTIGFLLQRAVVWFGRPRFLIPPRFRSIPGEERRRVQRRQVRSFIPGAGTLVGGLIGAGVAAAAGIFTSEVMPSYGHNFVDKNWGRSVRDWDMSW